MFIFHVLRPHPPVYYLRPLFPYNFTLLQSSSTWYNTVMKNILSLSHVSRIQSICEFIIALMANNQH